MKLWLQHILASSLPPRYHGQLNWAYRQLSPFRDFMGMLSGISVPCLDSVHGLLLYDGTQTGVHLSPSHQHLLHQGVQANCLSYIEINCFRSCLEGAYSQQGSAKYDKHQLSKLHVKIPLDE